MYIYTHTILCVLTGRETGWKAWGLLFLSGTETTVAVSTTQKTDLHVNMHPQSRATFHLAPPSALAPPTFLHQEAFYGWGLIFLESSGDDEVGTIAQGRREPFGMSA